MRWISSGAADVALGLIRRSKGSAAAALLLSFLPAFGNGVAAQQQQTPSDDELRCMYCIEVIRAEIDLQHHMIAAADEAAGSSSEAPAMREQWIKTSAELLQGLANLEGVLFRLQAYMLPRIPALDSLALASAIRQLRIDALWSAMRRTRATNRRRLAVPHAGITLCSRESVPVRVRRGCRAELGCTHARRLTRESASCTQTGAQCAASPLLAGNSRSRD